MVLKGSCGIFRYKKVRKKVLKRTFSSPVCPGEYFDTQIVRNIPDVKDTVKRPVFNENVLTIAYRCRLASLRGSFLKHIGLDDIFKQKSRHMEFGKLSLSFRKQDNRSSLSEIFHIQ